MKECVIFSVVQPAVLCSDVGRLSECRLMPAHRSAKMQLPNHLEFACSEMNRKNTKTLEAPLISPHVFERRTSGWSMRIPLLEE
jgi:hypothetical protein